MAMKYVVMKTSRGEIPIVFATSLYHNYVAGQLGGASHVVSAGFVRHTQMGIECYGGSSSLGIKARGERDTQLVRNHLDVAAAEKP